MTNGVLSDDIIVDGRLYPDLRSFHTSEMNSLLDAHSTSMHSRTAFYAQWALTESGFYSGPIDGKVGAGNSLYNAFVALYDSQYDGPDFTRPSGGHVNFKFYKAVIQDYSSVDPTIYKVVD